MIRYARALAFFIGELHDYHWRYSVSAAQLKQFAFWRRSEQLIFTALANLSAFRSLPLDLPSWTVYSGF
jgi:hypothetical protein